MTETPHNMTTMKKTSRYIVVALILFASANAGFAQEPMLIDRVIAKVGNETILLSDIESQYGFNVEQNGFADPSLKCGIMQSLIGQKLIVHHAKLDSVIVGEDEIESNLDFRISQVLRQMNGDEQFFEQYYGMTVATMRNNLRDDLRQQLLAERMQQTLLSEVTITPREVKEFFYSIPSDSLPYLNAEVELAEIVINPKVNQEENGKALKKIIEIRERIIGGSDFGEEAKIYSDDPGSGAQGGNLGFAERGTFVPEFEATAYSLKKGEISDPVETEFGYHILELLERRGNKINLRHILVKPAITEADREKAKSLLDSVRTEIINENITFTAALKKYSYDKLPSYNNNGMIQNPNTGKTVFETAELPSEVFFAIEEMNAGEITEAMDYPLPTGENYFRIIKILDKKRPHKASLEEDYAKIQNFAKESKKNEYFSSWLEEKFKNTFIKVEQGYLDCPELDEMLK